MMEIEQEIPYRSAVQMNLEWYGTAFIGAVH